MATEGAVLDQLDALGRRRTPARSDVVRAALRRRRPFTAQQLVTALGRLGIGRATVFRTLDLLVSVGALSRIHGVEHGARCVRYTACAPSHHHHLVCDACGRVEEIRASGLERRIARLAQLHGYQAIAHGLEVHGLCGACQP